MQYLSSQTNSKPYEKEKKHEFEIVEKTAETGDNQKNCTIIFVALAFFIL